VVGEDQNEAARTPGSTKTKADGADSPVGGRKLQWIALVVGILASLVTIIGFVLSSHSPDNKASPAARVDACESQHHLSQAETTIPNPAPTSAFTISSCAWPPGPGAQQDGYTAIDVQPYIPAGVAPPESSDSGIFDRIVSPCTRIKLTYTNGSQGKSTFITFTETVPTVVSMDSEPGPWPSPAEDLPFDPGPNEVDYIHNDDQTLAAASCVS
jgi:hypothetical protein